MVPHPLPVRGGTPYSPENCYFGLFQSTLPVGGGTYDDAFYPGA